MSKQPPYIALLSKEERAGAMKAGAVIGFARRGIPEHKIDQAVKEAGVIADTIDGSAKAIVATSLLAGIPLGSAAHVIGKKVTANRLKEREALARIKYYRDSTRQLESGLTGVPEEQVQQ